MQLNESFNKPLDSKQLQIKLYVVKNVLFQDAFNTSLQGVLDFNFKIPGKKSPLKLALMLQDMQKGADNQKIFVPVPLNRPEQTDLQFMPESGDLVNGLSSKIGFKQSGKTAKERTLPV